MKNQTECKEQVKTNPNGSVVSTIPSRSIDVRNTLAPSANDSIDDRQDNGATGYVEPDWLQRKLRNIERLATLEDVHDILYSELFIAFEILSKRFCASSLNPMRQQYLSTVDNIGVRKQIVYLRRAQIISNSQANYVHRAANQRNRLFHGDKVDLDDLSIDRLSNVLLTLLEKCPAGRR